MKTTCLWNFWPIASSSYRHSRSVRGRGLPRTGPFQAPDYTCTRCVAIAPRSAFDPNESADTRLRDHPIGKRVETLLLLARGAVLVAGHSHQSKKPRQANRPSDNN